MRNTKIAGFSRRAAILTAAAILVAARVPQRKMLRVLFVCLHGTVKSPIARAVMRSRAKARGIAVQVRSRGIEPEEGASPEVAAALVREGIDVYRDPVRRLGQADIAWADIVVFFDPLPFAASGKDLRDWRETPSVSQHYAEALDQIRRRIEALLDNLAQPR